MRDWPMGVNECYGDISTVILHGYETNDDTRLAARAHTALDSLFVQWGCSDTDAFSIGYAFGRLI